jgi:hypothetical protein
MTGIDWQRAAFVGAILGGFVWAVIIKLISLQYPDMPWPARTVLIAGVVNAALLVIGWLRWRSATGERGRTLAAALWVVPFIGVAFFATIVVVGRSADLLGS